MPSPPASGSSGMPAIDGAMNKAIEAHRAGRTSVAEIGYTSILDFDPDHSTALHLRGFVRLQQGRPGDGLDDLRKAVVRNPSNAQAWAHLAACQLALGIQALEPAARRAPLRPRRVCHLLTRYFCLLDRLRPFRKRTVFRQGSDLVRIVRRHRTAVCRRPRGWSGGAHARMKSAPCQWTRRHAPTRRDAHNAHPRHSGRRLHHWLWCCGHAHSRRPAPPR